MVQATSPWLSQMKGKYRSAVLSNNIKAEVAIVGGGIAGVCTAYFILKNTNLDVVLIEGNKIAHGATGHNAGQLVSHFERSTSDIIQEFGVKLTIDACNNVYSAWNLLQEIYDDARLKTPYSQFVGYDGCNNLEQIVRHLETNAIYIQAGIPILPVLIAEKCEFIDKILQQYAELYSLVPHKKILSLLETHDKNYIAAVCSKKGCMNSALFCEELVTFLLNKYPKKFVLYEKSYVKNIYLEQECAHLDVSEYKVKASKVVLCTNGYKKFKIFNTAGDDIDSQFQKSVRGLIGYMHGYLEPSHKSPIAIGYEHIRSYTHHDIYDADPYYYVTRRPFIREGKACDLICVGGPEFKLENSLEYVPEAPYLEDAWRNIQTFLNKTHNAGSDRTAEYQWHGLLGYTQNGIRYIGAEPLNGALLYNLGCNGVGILPSIYGGFKIAQTLKGIKQEKSIFDPRITQG